MKKWLIIVGIAVSIVITVVAATMLPPTWSKRSFEAVVQESATEQGGITRLTALKITEIYGDPLCALHISESTEILDEDGNEISVRDIQPGYTVKVTLKDSSVEGNPTYYPTVFEIKVIKCD